MGDAPPSRLGSQNSPILAATLLTLWGVATLIWWGLAFPPLIQAPPPWLARVQAICFGTDASGSPAAYGWGALVAGPAGILAALLVGWMQELRGGIAALWRRPLGRALLVGLSLAVAGEGAWVLWRGPAASTEAVWPSGTSDATLPEGYARLNAPVPSFKLVDALGETRTPQSLLGRTVVLTFAYGHCTTVCPATIGTIQAALREVPELHAIAVVVTLDAWRDTPSTLGAMMRKWGLPPDAMVLSGHVVEVNRVLDEFNVVRYRNERTGDIDHVSLVYVIDAQGRIAFAFSNPSPAWLAEALRRAEQPG